MYPKLSILVLPGPLLRTKDRTSRTAAVRMKRTAAHWEFYTLQQNFLCMIVQIKKTMSWKMNSSNFKGGSFYVEKWWTLPILGVAALILKSATRNIVNYWKVWPTDSKWLKRSVLNLNFYVSNSKFLNLHLSFENMPA